MIQISSKEQAIGKVLTKSLVIELEASAAKDVPNGAENASINNTNLECNEMNSNQTDDSKNCVQKSSQRVHEAAEKEVQDSGNGGSAEESNFNPKQLEEESKEVNDSEKVVEREKEKNSECLPVVVEEANDIVNEKLFPGKKEVLEMEEGINQEEGLKHEEAVSDRQTESSFEAVNHKEKSTTSRLAENSQSKQGDSSESLLKTDQLYVVKDGNGVKNINDNMSSTPKILMSEVASTTPYVEVKAEAARDECLNENCGKSDLQLESNCTVKSSEENSNSNVEDCPTIISRIQENLESSTDKQCLSSVRKTVESCIVTEQMEGNSLIIKDKNLLGKGTATQELVDFDKDEMMTDSQLNMLDDEILSMVIKNGDSEIENEEREKKQQKTVEDYYASGALLMKGLIDEISGVTKTIVSTKKFVDTLKRERQTRINTIWKYNQSNMN
ncbi:uncharacterized protein DDB_G0279979-like isoform X2 [Rhopilema esculentum]|uniref:uncharacterized protein DDB_G0279979-like isoform X2 n=1 Tax=Rhopilema esculentum TaxID=499914 RepID=UPI0031E411BD